MVRVPLRPPPPSPSLRSDSENQSTGLERFELLGKLEGVDVFDMKPLQVDRLGTMKEPIEVYSLVGVHAGYRERADGMNGLGRGESTGDAEDNAQGDDGL